MRLNLPRHNCVRFEITGESTVSLERDDEIQLFMDRTHTHEPSEDDEYNTRVALFGSRARSGTVTHQMQGRLTRRRLVSGLEIELFVASRRVFGSIGRPPRALKSVSVLVENSSRLFGRINLRCHAVFEYDQNGPDRSRVSLPSPLMFEESGGITHIESAQFSRRAGDKIEYQIVVVTSDDPEAVIHSVDFEATAELSIGEVREILRKAQFISRQLLIRLGDK